VLELKVYLPSLNLHILRCDLAKNEKCQEKYSHIIIDISVKVYY
jgi:hypothetical protein